MLIFPIYQAMMHFQGADSLADSSVLCIKSIKNDIFHKIISAKPIRFSNFSVLNWFYSSVGPPSFSMIWSMNLRWISIAIRICSIFISLQHEWISFINPTFVLRDGFLAWNFDVCPRAGMGVDHRKDIVPKTGLESQDLGWIPVNSSDRMVPDQSVNKTCHNLKWIKI